MHFFLKYCSGLTTRGFFFRNFLDPNTLLGMSISRLMKNLKKYDIIEIHEIEKR